jgi:hypothetical protein
MTRAKHSRRYLLASRRVARSLAIRHFACGFILLLRNPSRDAALLDIDAN